MHKFEEKKNRLKFKTIFNLTFLVKLKLDVDEHLYLTTHRKI